MTLSVLFHENNEYGRFVDVGPYPTNKQVCDAKRLLKDNLELEQLPITNFQWIVNDTEGKVGWHAVAVDVSCICCIAHCIEGCDCHCHAVDVSPQRSTRGVLP